jgi:hypothetical protein
MSVGEKAQSDLEFINSDKSDGLTINIFSIMLK